MAYASWKNKWFAWWLALFVSLALPWQAHAVKADPARSSKSKTQTSQSKQAAKSKSGLTRSAKAKALRQQRGEILSARSKALKSKQSRTASRRANALLAKRDGSGRKTLASQGNRATRPALVRTSMHSASPAHLTGAVASAGSVRASYGQLYGLHQTPDPLDLRSSVALVMDQDTNEVVFAKNSDAVLPIASLTKLMTALIVVEARLSHDEYITITLDDVDTEKHSGSRLSVGTSLTRGELLHLALMSSENRAAHALGRTYPGGLSAFIRAMNSKARSLGMNDTHYVDPTGLNSKNQSSARDLAVLAKMAYQHPLIRDLSVRPEHAVDVGKKQLHYRNTNSLVRNPAWDIGLQKTGYIVEAGRCLVMQARMAGRKFIMVFLDADGKQARQADAERVRRWIEQSSVKDGTGGAVSSSRSS